MTFYFFLWLFSLNLSWYRFSLEDFQIKIKWLGKFNSEVIPISNTIEIKKIITLLEGRRGHGFGNTFIWNSVAIKFYNEKNKVPELKQIVPDDPTLFVNQVKTMIDDSRIQGYTMPHSSIKNLLLVFTFFLLATGCFLISDFKNATILGGVYAVIALLLYNICKKLIYKILYKDLYVNLEKYAIRD